MKARARPVSCAACARCSRWNMTVLCRSPAAITTLLDRTELVVEKRTKRGMAETDIRPMLHAYHVEAAPGALLLTCEVSAQEPSLNPMLLAAAIERYLPEAKPDFVRCRRLEMLDEQGEVFR